MKSQSLLTRQLFRAITANRSYRIPGCPQQTLVHRHHRDGRSFTTSSRRHMFGLGFGSTIEGLSGSKPTVANIDAALARFVVLLNARRNQTRAPPDEQLIDAFQFLFSARASKEMPLTRTEVYLAYETFIYLQSRDRVLSEAPLCQPHHGGSNKLYSWFWPRLLQQRVYEAITRLWLRRFLRFFVNVPI